MNAIAYDSADLIMCANMKENAIATTILHEIMNISMEIVKM